MPAGWQMVMPLPVFFFFLFFIKKTSQGIEGGRTGTAVDERTEPAHWPLGDMREWEENPAQGSRQKNQLKKCPVNTEAILLAVAGLYISLMVLSSDLVLAPEHQAWTGNPNNKYCWFLYLHECRCLFFCLFSSNSVTKKVSQLDL